MCVVCNVQRPSCSECFPLPARLDLLTPHCHFYLTVPLIPPLPHRSCFHLFSINTIFTVAFIGGTLFSSVHRRWWHCSWLEFVDFCAMVRKWPPEKWFSSLNSSNSNPKYTIFDGWLIIADLFVKQKYFFPVNAANCLPLDCVLQNVLNIKY